MSDPPANQNGAADHGSGVDERLTYVAGMTTSSSEPLTVATSIDGQPWRARVRQFHDRAYIEVWGDGGFDADTQIVTTDVLATMRQILAGERMLGCTDHDIVHRAATVFRAAGRLDGG